MKIDCRNLSCPQPIVETKNALEKLQENEILEIVLNSIISKNNVVKFLNSLNLNPVVDENAQEFCIKVQKKNFDSSQNFVPLQKLFELPVCLLFSLKK